MNFTWAWVALLYAAAVWLARRGGAALPRRVAVVFAVLVFSFLWRPLTQDVTIVPADTIRLIPPWSEVRAPGRPPVTKYEISNLNQHDVPMQIVPWMHQVRTSSMLWNAAAGCGYPLLANGQSTPLSPVRWLTYPLPLPFAMAGEGAIKLLIALTLAYLFCRTRYSPLASTMAAIAYGFSTWMTTWLQFPIATAAAFLPGVLLVIDRLIDGFTRKRFAIAVLMFATAVLSGHPETVFHIGLIAAAYGIWMSFLRAPRSALRPLLRVAAASVVAALIASPFLVPFAEAVVRSQRYAEMRAPRATLEPPFSDFFSAVLLLQPRFFGELPVERPWGPTTLESICGFAGVLAIVATIAAAIFMVMRRRWRDVETLYVLGAIVSLGIVLGWPLLTEAFHAVAGLAPPMRMRLGLCFFTSMLVAAVVDWTRRDSRVPLLAGTAVTAGAMFWLLRTIPFPTPSHRDTALLSLFPSLGVLLALAVPLVRFHLAAVFTVVELFLAIGQWHPVLSPREFYRPTPLVTKLLALQRAEAQPFRILGTGGQLYPNVGAMFGFEDVRVHDPMAGARYVALLARSVGWNPSDYYAKWNDTASPLIDALNVKYVIADRELSEPRYELVYAGRDGRIYRNRNALPRFYGADVTVVRWRPDAYTLRINAPHPLVVSSSIPNWPGWRVPFPRQEVNGLFLGFTVPAGTHEVEVAYRPLSFYAPAVIALLTLATLLWLCRSRRA